MLSSILEQFLEILMVMLFVCVIAVVCAWVLDRPFDAKLFRTLTLGEFANIIGFPCIVQWHGKISVVL